MRSLPRNANMIANNPVRMEYTMMKSIDVVMIDLVELDDVLFNPSETKTFLPSRPKYFRRRQNMMMNPIPPAHPVVALQIRI